MSNSVYGVDTRKKIGRAEDTETKIVMVSFFFFYGLQHISILQHFKTNDPGKSTFSG